MTGNQFIKVPPADILISDFYGNILALRKWVRARYGLYPALMVVQIQIGV